MQKIQIEQHSATGLLWIAGWLFTIGFLQLAFWRSVAALFVWSSSPSGIPSGAALWSRLARVALLLMVFLPTWCEHRRWSDRVKKIERAVFAGYVFCRLNGDAAGKLILRE